MQKIQRYNKKGFTIIETLVAVSILMISVAGPLTIAQKGLNASIYARDQVTATFLAQDALEYIRNIKDNNIIYFGDKNAWLNIIDSCLQEGVECGIDTANEAIYPGSGFDLYLSDGYGYTTNDSGNIKTPFSRKFKLYNSIYNDQEVRVEVIVSWKNGTINNVVTLENLLFNNTR